MSARARLLEANTLRTQVKLPRLYLRLFLQESPEQQKDNWERGLGLLTFTRRDQWLDISWPTLSADVGLTLHGRTWLAVTLFECLLTLAFTHEVVRVLPEGFLALDMITYILNLSCFWSTPLSTLCNSWFLCRYFRWDFCQENPLSTRSSHRRDQWLDSVTTSRLCVGHDILHSTIYAVFGILVQAPSVELQLRARKFRLRPGRVQIRASPCTR